MALTLLSSAARAQILSVDLHSTYIPAHSSNVKGVVRLKEGVGGGVTVMYGYRDRALEMTLDVVPVVVKGDRIDGRLQMMPLIFSGYWRYHPFGRRWFPYLGVGLGTIITSFRESPGARYNVDMADPIALEGTLGFQYFMIKDWAVTLKVQYLYAQAHVQLTEAGTDSSQTDAFKLSTWIGSFGITKYF